ncbi:uncharacterized protein EDB91DRAFT_1060435 [Suillus paluster]|uniref:uncharacterized protein n=1 Tax=Suillus paluster TaxID=48578 RepID=UPI001B85C387|nr:uncharacterized protein EDB91DRAFT_1060435 [Suillus paluster]KAG1728586.1 hypothetical protein EDB91DRAFT_1060435 [Suillus paluster]
MWWPARVSIALPAGSYQFIQGNGQVVQKDPLRVTLFGDLASSREPSTISSPSEYNIQPIHNVSGEKLFTRATFQVSSLTKAEPSNPSPRKKAKTDICERWEAAVKAMEDADGLKRDGMPEMISAYTGGTFSSEEEDVDDLRSTKKVKVTPHAEFEVLTDRAWSPPPPDPMLQIPGELVLAQALRTRSNKYWPAQLISYVPPTKPGGKERYRAKFLDDREYNLTRDKFWTSEERGFVMCDLGEFESAVQDTETPDSEDEQEDRKRSPSPQLSDPPPDADDFADLSMHAQLAYVKPVLKAILQGKYAPASKSHEAFMRGGAARSNLMKRAAVRGGLDPNEVKRSQKLLARWALGEGYACRANVEIKPQGDAVLPPGQEKTPCASAVAADGDGLAEAGAGSEITATSDTAGQDISQPIPPSDIGNQVNDTSAMAVDKPTPEKADEATSDIAGHHDMSQPLPPSNIRSQVDDPSAMSLNKLADEISPTSDSASPDRPVGSQEYETLTTLDKLDYCVNILLPEAIQQLLLWRSGERTTAALLSPTEEERLHERGAAKAQETDWVFDLLRLRAAQARLWGVDLKAKGKEKDKGGVGGGTRSRPHKATISR